MKEQLVNPTAERAIITILLHDVSKVIDCSNEELTSEHFGVQANRVLYSVICYLAEEGVKEVDSEAIYSVLTNESSRKIIDDFGGREYLDILLKSIRVADNLSMYIKQVKECNLRRLVFDLGESLKEDCVSEEDVSKMLVDTQKKINDIMLDGNAKEIHHMGEGTYERILERANNPTDVFGYRVGWEKFDKITQGFAPNDLAVVVGASKTGKSTLLTNWSRILSINSGLCGLYIDTEMTEEEQEDRIISMISKVPQEEIRNGMCGRDTEFGNGAEKMKRIVKACVQLKDARLFHKYMPDFTIPKVTALIRKMHIQENINYCIFDYIKLPGEDVKGLSSSQEYQRLGYFTTCLKDMAGICGIPVITAAQANRNDLNSTNPDAGDIGGSLRILQLATKLMFIRNKIPSELENENFSKGNQKLHIKYQRNGSGDSAVDIQFDRPILRQWEI